MTRPEVLYNLEAAVRAETWTRTPFVPLNEWLLTHSKAFTLVFALFLPIVWFSETARFAESLRLILCVNNFICPELNPKQLPHHGDGPGPGFTAGALEIHSL